MLKRRYYFNINDGENTIFDPVGTDFVAISGARDRALRLGQSIVSNVGAVVDVTNSSGESLMKAPLVITHPEEPGPDPLTGLPGRVTLVQHLEQAIRHHNQGPSLVGLLLLDLDRLKDVNDALGYPAGDAVLKHVAAILASQANASAYSIARLEGDKFAIVLRTDSRRLAIASAEALHTALREPLQYGEDLIGHPLSGGLALFPEHASTAAELVAGADIALHLAKVTGGGGLAIYTQSMKLDQERHFNGLADARTALAKHYLVPHYQPKVSLRSGAICGFEALLRIQHPSLGLQLPATIAAALDSPELSVAIGAEIQERVFDDIRGWIEAGVKFQAVAVNTSPVELLQSSYADGFLQRLAVRGIPPSLLQIEVTETAMTGHGSAKIIGELQKLRGAGVAVLLDDFGTGFGSLVHLRDFPINGIKIDRSFVKEAGKSSEAKAIVKVLISLALDLDLLLVAEGIETREQADYLRSEGCEVVQGFLYSKAIPARDIAPFVAHWNGSLILTREEWDIGHL
jgi:diguanylate cyclase (GGDEF)-like protein